MSKNTVGKIPKRLLEELSKYVGGQTIHVPTMKIREAWGSRSGTRQFIKRRDGSIYVEYKKMKIKKGYVKTLSEKYSLCEGAIRNIICKMKGKKGKRT